MNRFFVPVIAAAIALGSLTASAADMTADERAALRQRADELQRMRAQNPGAAQDGMKMDRPQGDLRLDKPRGEVKAKPKGAKPKSAKSKKSKRARAKSRLKRTAKELPGALVR